MATTTNFGWETPDDTDLVKDGALAMRTLGNAIDTSLVDLKGGTTGQVLSKTSNTDMDFTWVTTDDANAIQNAIVDAKGDLIAATANDTPARLAVGNDGESLIADSAVSTGLAYKPVPVMANPVINGAFDIWQRGTSIAFSGSSYIYTADRWKVVRGSFATGATVSRQATSDTTNLAIIQYCGRVQRDSGNTSTQPIEIATTFETANSIPYANRSVTVTFYARAGANYSSSSSNLSIEAVYGTGTDQSQENFTGRTAFISSTQALTTTWQRFAITGTVASTATEIGIKFSYTPVGTAGANDYFEITGVQLERGTYNANTAPAFRRSGGTLQGELAACQRYYQRATAGQAYGVVSYSGSANSTTVARIVFPIKVTFRTTPSSVEYANVILNDGTNVVAAGTITVGGDNTNVMTLTCTTTGLTQFRPYQLTGDNNAAGYVALSAEL